MNIPDIKCTNIPDAVLDRLGELGPDEARVLLAIAVCAQRSFDHQWLVPLECIVQQSGISASRALCALSELADAGYVITGHPADRDLWQVNLDNVGATEEAIA